jgi:hypothetical protein
MMRVSPEFRDLVKHIAEVQGITHTKATKLIAFKMQKGINFTITDYF